jgi:hypothetical protein
LRAVVVVLSTLVAVVVQAVIVLALLAHLREVGLVRNRY